MSEIGAEIPAIPFKALRRNFPGQPTLLPVVAEESEGANAIPLALAQRLSLEPGWEVEAGIIQSNVAARTGKDGYYRLAIQPVFDGVVDVHQPRPRHRSRWAGDGLRFTRGQAGFR